MSNSLTLQYFANEILSNYEINREIKRQAVSSNEYYFAQLYEGGEIMSLSENVKKIAKEKNITMYRIAKDGDLSMSYVWELTKGRKENPSIKILKKIANVLETTVDELIR